MDEHTLYDQTRRFRQDWGTLWETTAHRESGLAASKLLDIDEVDILVENINCIRLN